MKYFLTLSLFLFSNFSLAGQIYLTGQAQDMEKETLACVCLAGGGDDDEWAQGWIELLNSSQGGDVVIIRADGRRGGYEDWIYEDSSSLHFPKVNSVRTILLEKPSDSSSPQIIDVIKKAELIFFAGGDQSIYIDWLRGSKLLSAIEDAVYNRHVPIAGTSAGMALLAGIDYRAKYNSPRDNESMITAMDVLKNPLGEYVDLDNEVLVAPFLREVITETHFSARDRQGRIVGFMARALYNNPQLDYKNIKAIAADEGTAFCYNKNGIGKVYGAGEVYFLRGQAPVDRIVANQNLIWQGDRNAIAVQRLSHGQLFDLLQWQGPSARLENWWLNETYDGLPLLHQN